MLVVDQSPAVCNPGDGVPIIRVEQLNTIQPVIRFSDRHHTPW